MSGFGKVNCGGVLGGWEASDVELDLPAMLVLVWEDHRELLLMGSYPDG